MSTFADRLRYARKQAGLRQHHIATACGLSVNAVSLWERDIGTPSPVNLAILAKLLDVDMNWLITGQGVWPGQTDAGVIARKVLDESLHESDITLTKRAYEKLAKYLTARALKGHIPEKEEIQSLVRLFV